MDNRNIDKSTFVQNSWSEKPFEAIDLDLIMLLKFVRLLDSFASDMDTSSLDDMVKKVPRIRKLRGKEDIYSLRRGIFVADDRHENRSS